MVLGSSRGVPKDSIPVYIGIGCTNKQVLFIGRKHFNTHKSLPQMVYQLHVHLAHQDLIKSPYLVS